MLSLTINGLYKEVNMVDAVQEELHQLTSRYRPLLKHEPFNEVVEQLEYWLAQYQHGSLHALAFLTDNGRAMLSELKRQVRSTLVAMGAEPRYAVVAVDGKSHGFFTNAGSNLANEVDLDLEPMEEDEPDAYEVVSGVKTYNTFSVH